MSLTLGATATKRAPETQGEAGISQNAPALSSLLAENAALKEIDKNRSQMLTTAAHGLRSSAGGIVVYAELLLEEAFEQLTDNHKQLLHNILSSCESMLELSCGLLDVEAMDSGKMKMFLAPVELPDLVMESIALNQAAADRKHLKIELQCEDQLPKVRVDRLKILQVINELLANAIRFSNSGRRILVKLRLQDGFAQIAVLDEGPGILPEDAKKIFKPFPVLRDNSKACERGHGLGLAIAKRIVAAHKGSIGLDSQFGAGSTFTVSLPASSKSKNRVNAVLPITSS